MKLVNMADEYKGPIVVHCSAGVGRTGTYIAVHTNLHLVRKEKRKAKINMPQVVLHMRRYRPACVQHVDQVCLSACLAFFFLCFSYVDSFFLS
jgi:protein tyrosine phosphatase